MHIINELVNKNGGENYCKDAKLTDIKNIIVHNFIHY